MRVKLHGVSHDIGNLVVASIVHSLHRVENTSLHRLQTILDMRYGALKDYVGSIIQEPVLIHARKMVNYGCVKTINGTVIRRFRLVNFFYIIQVFFVVHEVCLFSPSV